MPDFKLCRQRILSEEYRDFIVSSRGGRLISGSGGKALPPEDTGGV